MPAIVPGLPGGGLPDQVLKLGENGRAQWVDPVAVAQKFRGEWVQDVQVLQYTFGGGIPTEFTIAKSGIANDPVAAAVANASAASPPPYTGAVKFSSTRLANNFYSELRLNLASLDIPGIVRATAWWGCPDLGSTGEDYQIGSFSVDGNLAASTSQTLRTWRQVSVACTSSSILGIRHRTSYPADVGLTTEAYMTGLTLYAAEEPYMLGQYVTYGGKMWRSLVDNNSATPAQGAYWTEALTLPLSSGTTAARPTATLAGLGFQYFDTTLGKPIWSTGAAWVDATGATV